MDVIKIMRIYSIVFAIIMTIRYILRHLTRIGKIKSRVISHKIERDHNGKLIKTLFVFKIFWIKRIVKTEFSTTNTEYDIYQIYVYKKDNGKHINGLEFTHVLACGNSIEKSHELKVKSQRVSDKHSMFWR